MKHFPYLSCLVQQPKEYYLYFVSLFFDLQKCQIYVLITLLYILLTSDLVFFRCLIADKSWFKQKAFIENKMASSNCDNFQSVFVSEQIWKRIFILIVMYTINWNSSSDPFEVYISLFHILYECFACETFQGFFRIQS